MVKLVIEIGLNNSAFEDDPLVEVRRILDRCVKKLAYNSLSCCAQHGTKLKLYDINSNHVGFAQVKEMDSDSEPGQCTVPCNRFNEIRAY